MCSNTATGSGALPDTTRRAPRNADRERRLGTDPRPHGGYAEVHRAARPPRTPAASACRCGSTAIRRAARRARRAPAHARGTAAGRAPACRRVSIARPRPRPSRSAATARRDSTTPFGRPVVPEVYMINAVEHRAGLGARPVASPIDRYLRQRDLGPLRITDGRRRARVAQHVFAFHRPGVGGHRHHGHSGHQAGDDADHGVECRGGPQRDCGHAGEPLRHSRRRASASCDHDTASPAR